MYTLIVVRTDGFSHSTTAEGHFCESMLDKQFNEVIADRRTRYAVVFDAPDSIRREFHATFQGPKRGGPAYDG